uniref:Uncharacterized protein n=1 Tax=Chryseobacterium endophyticum TaxID=1854762 RepID=A0AAU6WQC9_9FLAO
MNLKKFLNEEQDPQAVEKLLGRINSLLTSQETVEYIAVQKNRSSISLQNVLL